MPTKPVAPVSRRAPSGMSARAASDTGFRDSSGRVRSVQAGGRGPPVQWQGGEPSQPLTRPAVQVTRIWALPGAGALKRAWSDAPIEQGGAGAAGSRDEVDESHDVRAFRRLRAQLACPHGCPPTSRLTAA